MVNNISVGVYMSTYFSIYYLLHFYTYVSLDSIILLLVIYVIYDLDDNIVIYYLGFNYFYNSLNNYYLVILFK